MDTFKVAMRLIAVAQSVNSGNAPTGVDVLDQYDEAFFKTALPAFGDITFANCTALVSDTNRNLEMCGSIRTLVMLIISFTVVTRPP